MPLIRDSRLAILLRDGQIEEFNRLAAGTKPDLRDTDLRMLDLRKADLAHADLTGAYLRNADMRSLDLSQAILEGASVHDANIAGVLFPVALSAEEIRLSHDVGTRMRYR
jgi:uncharacterized protein YjbI with pentapeptide repeats